MTTLLTLLLLLSPVSHARASDITIYDLRTEFRSDPIGIDSSRPRLSWKLRSDTRGQTQTAYRILVASSPVHLAGAEGDLWDSGRVDSDSTHLVPYAGAPLAPGQTAYWTVRVWDRDGARSPWSTPARWTMGRLGEWDPAIWIGLDSLSQAGLQMKPDQLPLLRRAFDAVRPVRRALVHITGLGSFELFANGEKVSDDVLSPGWTDYSETVLYRSYDLTGMLRQGENVLGVALGHGMYHIPGSPGDGRFAKFRSSSGYPKTILHLTIEYNDGTIATVTSDEGWRMSGGPTLFSSIWGGEDYDARLEQSGWDAPGFDDGDWFPVAVLDGPGGALRAQATPPLTTHEVYRPINIAEPAPGVFLYDLGQNLSGRMELRVRGPAGSTVVLRPSEVIGSDGLIDQSSMAHDGEISFSYTLNGDGAESWHPRFTYTGFRYVQVEGATPNPEEAAQRGIPLLLGLESRFIHADAPATGSVTTSSARLDGIHHLIVQAIRSNAMSVMTDCPHREKLGWLEQAYLHAAGIHHNLDAANIYAKWTNDMAEAQTSDGLVPDIAPEFTVFQGGFRDSPEWGSAFILAPLAAYDHFGDLRPLRTHYEAMKRYVDYLESRRDERGLVAHGLGDWYDIAPGPPGPSKLTSLGVTGTAIYHADLVGLARIARLLDREEESARFEARAEEVRLAFNAAFFDASTGRYDAGSQTAQAMPLAMGLVPEGYRDRVLAHLVDDIVSHGMHTTAGDIGHRYVLLALLEAGRSDLIYAMAINPEPPSYAAQLLSGATTLTEAWDGNPKSSQNHFMLGHLEEWLFSGLGGLRVAEPGYRRVVFRPEIIDSLDHAEVVYSSVRGPIRSAWRRESGRVIVEVEIPPGVEASVHLPTQNREEVTEGGGWALEAEGVTFQSVDSDRLIFSVDSGRYRFDYPTR